MSTVPVPSGFALPSSFGRDECTGDPVAQLSMHIFSGACSAEIARIASLMDAQLHSAIDLYEWKFAKETLVHSLCPSKTLNANSRIDKLCLQNFLR